MVGRSFLHGLLALAVAAASSACAAAPEAEEDGAAEDVAETEDALGLTLRGLQESEMSLTAQPRGLPPAWDQPDSDGWFDERGKCGPTAVANALRLYGDERVSPEQAYRDGVGWYVGTRASDVVEYLGRTHPELGCRITHPVDGPRYLREQTRAGRPVMAWFRTKGLQSHWVTVVGVVGTGYGEAVIAMSWGAYYRIPMARFEEAWRSVYGLRRPSVVCAARTARVVR